MTLLYAVFIPASLSVALLVEWAVIQRALFGAPVSLFVFVLLFWFWRLSSPGRLWLGIGAGFVSDLWSPLPFGTHLILFPLLAFLTSFLRRVMISSDERISQLLGRMGVSYALFLVLRFIEYRIFYFDKLL